MALRYNDYRELTAKFDSQGKCGHSVKKGDVIGIAYTRYPKESHVQCAECWRKWTNDVRNESEGAW